MKFFVEKVIKTDAHISYDRVGLHTFINPFSYLKIRKKRLLEQFDYIYIDGFLLVSILKLMGIKVSRNSFDMTSLAKKVFNESIKNKKRIYLIGSSNEVMLKFINIVETNFTNINIIGYRGGFFNSSEEREQTIHSILSIKPDIVIVGMGTPLQEHFLIDLSIAGWQGIGYTCGGFIHQTANKLNYYPPFFNKYNLRWLYRIYDEPKLAKRYFVYYPVSIALFLKDVLILKIKKFLLNF